MIGKLSERKMKKKKRVRQPRLDVLLLYKPIILRSLLVVQESNIETKTNTSYLQIPQSYIFVRI